MITSVKVTLPYRAILKGKNCEDDKLVLKEDECKIASETVGAEYVGRTTSRDRPAGCYWARRSLSNRDYIYSYFNTIVDASSAEPTNGREHGGICSTSNNKSYTGKFQGIPRIKK